MKRILFCVGVLALAASCTESEFDSTSVQNGQTKGITFQAEEANDAATRGGFIEGEGSFVPFWYAEKDKIAVWGTKVTGTNGVNAGTDFFAEKKATYKATQSAKLGVFTGASDADVLDFDGSTAKTPSKFFAIYPSTLTATYDASIFTIDLKSMALETQTQNDLMGDGIYDKVVKYSATQAYPENPYDAVGEKISLNFQRVLSGMVFSTINADKYTKGANSIFGKLKTITLTAKGKKADGSDAASISKLTLGSTAASLAVDVTDIDEPEVTLDADAANAQNEIVLTLKDANGLEWSDAANAYMVMAPVKHAAEEYVIAKYDFANITLSDTIKTSKEWVAGKFYAFKTLDINSFNYLVTNGNGSGDNRALIINKGHLSDIFDGTEVKWNNSTIAAEKFSDIVCNVELNETELKSLAKFTALKNITLSNNTTIPADAFKGNTGLLSINMPLVTTIDAKAFESLASLTSLKLGSYQFENEKVNANLLANKTGIATLDISGVEDMTPTFGIERQLDFSGFTALEEVTVKEGVQLSANAFNECTSLETVNGTVKLAVSAFEQCSALTEINIEGTVIPDNAFKDCTALESVMVNKAQVVPTSVGASAFEDADAVKYMDLSKVTKLGASAFKGSALISTSKSNAILTVGAASIPASAFESTAVKMVEFTNATSFAVDILKDCSSLIQVKFAVTFNIQDSDMPSVVGGWSNTFGTAANVNLFVVPGQKYVSDNKLTLPYKSGSAVKDATPITFKGLYAK